MKDVYPAKNPCGSAMDTHTFAFAHLYNDEKRWICISMTAMKSTNSIFRRKTVSDR